MSTLPRSRSWKLLSWAVSRSQAYFGIWGSRGAREQPGDEWARGTSGLGGRS